MTTKEAELLAKFDEAIELAEEALELAQEYAGNESETALAISKKISKLARSIKEYFRTTRALPACLPESFSLSILYVP